MNLRKCPVCEGMVLETTGAINWDQEGQRGPIFERHLPANRSKEPATHMDGACFGSYAPTLVARAERVGVSDDEFNHLGQPR